MIKDSRRMGNISCGECKKVYPMFDKYGHSYLCKHISVGTFASYWTQASLRYFLIQNKIERRNVVKRFNEWYWRYIYNIKHNDFMSDWRSGSGIGDYNPHFILSRIKTCSNSNWYLHSRGFYGGLSRLINRFTKNYKLSP